MRLLLDTKVLVSAVLFDGLPERLLERALRGDYDLVTSEALLDAFEEVMRQRFARPPALARAIRDELASIAEVVRPERITRTSRDPADDMVLAAAHAGRADAIATGDKDVLELVAYQGIAILTTRQTLAMLESEESG